MLDVAPALAAPPAAAPSQAQDGRFDLPASVAPSAAPAVTEWRSLAPLGYPSYSINAAGTVRREVAGAAGWPRLVLS